MGEPRVTRAHPHVAHLGGTVAALRLAPLPPGRATRTSCISLTIYIVSECSCGVATRTPSSEAAYEPARGGYPPGLPSLPQSHTWVRTDPAVVRARGRLPVHAAASASLGLLGAAGPSSTRSSLGLRPWGSFGQAGPGIRDMRSSA